MLEFPPGAPGDFRSQRYRDYQRQRQYQTNDILLENRIIFFGCAGGTFYAPEINDITANVVIQQMLYLQYENRNQEIHFYINSPGGSVTSTLAIYDTMQFLECPIATYCIGMAASGAAILLAAGAKGKRFALPNSRVMIHQPSGGAQGQATDIEIQAKEILYLRERLNKMLADHTGQPIERIARDVERDYFMSAEQAKDYGLVDQILDRRVVPVPAP
jgi:ATP-dependent Clp protease protease subunit